MTSRLKESFDREGLFTIGTIASDIEINWARFGEAFHELNKQGDLLRAADTLVSAIEQSPAEVREREAIVKAVAQVQKAIKLIDAEAALLARRMHT
jgi:hypothetical protein